MNVHTLEQIETKIAFLERANAELSDVVFRQHLEIELAGSQTGEHYNRNETQPSHARGPEDCSGFDSFLSAGRLEHDAMTIDRCDAHSAPETYA